MFIISVNLHCFKNPGQRVWSLLLQTCRYLNGVKTDLDMHSFISEASGSVKGLRADSSLDSSSCLLPSQVSSFRLSKAARSSSVLPHPQLHSANHLGQQQQSSYTESEFGLLQPVKQENGPLRPFFDEWPKTRDLWPDLEDERSNQISFSNTQLSISIPMASSDFSTTASRSSNSEFLTLHSNKPLNYQLFWCPNGVPNSLLLHCRWLTKKSASAEAKGVLNFPCWGMLGSWKLVIVQFSKLCLNSKRTPHSSMYFAVSVVSELHTVNVKLELSQWCCNLFLC